MNKLTALLFLLLVVLLLDFVLELENALPSLVLKLIKFNLGKLTMFVLVYGSFAFGLLSG